MSEIINEAAATEEAVPAREPIFAVDTLHDTARYVRFNMNHLKRRKWFWITMLILTAFVTLTCVFYFAMFGFDTDMLVCLALIWAIDLIYVTFVLVLPRVVYKKSPAYMAVSHIEFFDDGFTEDTRTATTVEHVEHTYEVLKLLCEGKEDIYLYIEPNRAYLIDKSGFTLGNAESLKRFLYTRVDPKIVKYKS